MNFLKGAFANKIKQASHDEELEEEKT